MNFYSLKLIKKIRKHNAIILFIGENNTTIELASDLSSRGFNIFFEADEQLKNASILTNKGIHLTNLVYEVFDSDIVFISYPNTGHENNIIKKYLKEKIDWIKRFFHPGIMVLVDSKYLHLFVDLIKDSLEMAAYNDPAAPLIELYKNEANYFFYSFNFSDYKKIRLNLINNDKNHLLSELF